MRVIAVIVFVADIGVAAGACDSLARSWHTSLGASLSASKSA